ncbi:hypothetical protein LCGC14_3096110, partial [marine sediment metagenome]
PAEADPLSALRRDFCNDSAQPGTRVTTRKSGDAATASGKVTLFAMNSALMVVSMPVGAGLMTYNLLSGGSISTTARATGVTGAVLGISTLSATQSAAATVANEALPMMKSIAGPIAELASKIAPMFQSLTALF